MRRIFFDPFHRGWKQLGIHRTVVGAWLVDNLLETAPTQKLSVVVVFKVTQPDESATVSVLVKNCGQAWQRQVGIAAREREKIMLRMIEQNNAAIADDDIACETYMRLNSNPWRAS